MPPDFAFAILGGGAAGLSLALALTRSPLKDRPILVIDREEKKRNDRTWSFWTDEPSPCEALGRQTWGRVAFISDSFERAWELDPFRYIMLRGIDFYDHARAELKKHNVTFMLGEGEVRDGTDSALLRVGGREVEAEWAFDSRIRPEDLVPRPGYNHLRQHFLGWEVETSKPVFDPAVVTMFDLRTPQRQGITFFYTLPFNPTHALVEYTLFSPQLLPLQDYESALREHLDGLDAGAWRVLEVERGIIPMTDQPFPRRLGRRVLAIGTRGGRVKPSTGYAFSRIQRDSARIVRSLLQHGHPFAIPPDRLRHRLHDSILLEVLACEPGLGKPIFSAIFARNPVQRVLKFLDDRSSPLEDLQIMASHAPWPFLRAIQRRYLHGR